MIWLTELSHEVARQVIFLLELALSVGEAASISELALAIFKVST